MEDGALRALLAHSVDYAGLFPPAGLPLATALANHASYVRDRDVWMLGAFVLPTAKFPEAGANLAGFDVEHLLKISALAPATETPAEFIKTLKNVADTINSFHAQFGATAAVTQIEMPLPTRSGAAVAEATEALGDVQLPVFWEAPPDQAERAIAAIAAVNNANGSDRFGFKLRTGGVVASAFPSSIQVARALLAAVTHRVPIKFTAGLHHPVRQFHSSVHTKMHGFLNVLGAGVLAAEHGWDLMQTSKMLDDEAEFSFTGDKDFFGWREWRVAVHRIREHRKLVTSFGSCSFDEPREDLRALNLLYA
jgi:hypothetical protein